LVGATGGLRLAGSTGQAYLRDGSFGAIFTPVEPVELNKLAYGAGCRRK
jgi:hypothetical protein